MFLLLEKMGQIIRINLQIFRNICNLDTVMEMLKYIILHGSNQRILITALIRLQFFRHDICVHPLCHPLECFHFDNIVNFFNLLIILSAIVKDFSTLTPASTAVRDASVIFPIATFL